MRVSTKKRLAILPDSGQDLLRDEISLALETLGFEVLHVHPGDLEDQNHPQYLHRLIEQKPALFLSVNLQGLIPGAPRVRPLLEADIPVLGWFVDNPWYLLSAMRDPSWRSITLAVTDKNFVEPLTADGAQKVLHLPLGTSPWHMQNAGDVPRELGGIVFVGRSAFPNLETFFAGQEAPLPSLERASRLLSAGFGPNSPRPDFAWWLNELELENTPLWPGKKGRRPGHGAVECNIAWRAACLNAAQGYSAGLTVFGDSAWAGIKDLRAQVDYYTQLPAIYRSARFTLNLNSLLLPAGLSQRIFDVWAARGFCLTDWSQGLEIFPPELTGPVCFNAPEEIPHLAARLFADPAAKERLRRDWQEHILAEHSYEKRLSYALGQMDLL